MACLICSGRQGQADMVRCRKLLHGAEVNFLLFPLPLCLSPVFLLACLISALFSIAIRKARQSLFDGLELRLKDGLFSPS